MPRAVQVAVATASLITLLGIASIVAWVGDLLTHGSVSSALGSRAFWPLASLCLMAAGVPLAAVRHDSRIRELAFHFALLAAMLLGFGAPFLVVALLGDFTADSALELAAFVLATVLASSLSRPSAKAWFSSRLG